jgi:hypothetical protein
VVAVSDADVAVGTGEEGVPAGGVGPEDAAEGVEEITRKPARLSAVLATVAAAVAVLSTLYGGTVALALAALGLPTLGLALLVGYSRAIDLAGLLLLSGVCYGGIGGAPVAAVLLGIVGSTLAWDLANYAFSVGYQLGREARTERVEVLHAAASTGVGVVSAGVGYVLFRSGAEGLPVTTVAVMLLGALALVAVLRL